MINVLTYFILIQIHLIWKTSKFSDYYIFKASNCLKNNLIQYSREITFIVVFKKIKGKEDCRNRLQRKWICWWFHQETYVAFS